MINDFLVVLMTKNLRKQAEFYRNTLELDLIFDNQDAIGLGRGERIFIVIREDRQHDSHHLADEKGPQIMTFKCDGDVSWYINRIKEHGYIIRDEVKLPAYQTHYLFIEDFDGNEVCLDFPLITTS